MNDSKILFTGDFWHADFRAIVSGFEAPMTLVPIEKIGSMSESDYDLVVVAQSRRGQFSIQSIETIQSVFPATPIVGLLGSWCEGETRSGDPWPGVLRVYWHQWEGRYATFAEQLSKNGVTDWHCPRTSSVGDLVANSNFAVKSDLSLFVAISAWTATQHSMISDAIESFGWSSCWVERAVWNAETVSAVDSICVEADLWCEDLENRIKWIRAEVPNTPIVLVINYPRQDELEQIRSAGITQVVSKPFELKELQSAIKKSVLTVPTQKLESADV